MENVKKLTKRLIELESRHFELYNRLKMLDELFYKIGFPDGISSLKKVAEKMKDEKIGN